MSDEASSGSGSGSGGSDNDEGGESRGKMVQRHKREQKALKSKTDALLHAVPKNDKKRKQEAAEQVKKMETELAARHAAELLSLTKIATASPTPALSLAGAGSAKPAAQAKQPSKAQKKRDAKSKAEQQRAKEAAIEKAGAVNPRAVELEKIKKQLTPMNLAVKEIPSDGNCLYAAVIDQLKLHNGPKASDLHTVAGLRAATADWILKHSAEFAPFILAAEEDEQQGAASSGGGDPVEEYCGRLRSKPVWGGEIELKALSELLRIGIVVHAADSPVVEMGTTAASSAVAPPLRVSFHRHYYTLGAHYNSVVPAAPVESDEH